MTSRDPGSASPESAERYRELYETAPIGYLTLDAEGVIVEANATAAVLLGVDRQRAFGRELAAFLSVRDADTFRRHHAAALAGEGKRVCEVRIEREDGSGVPARLELVAAPGDGEPARARVVVFDLTELHQAQEGLRTQESQTRTILDTAADAIIGIDVAGRIESFNPAAERMFGYREEEVRGENVRMLMPSPYQHEHDGYLERYLVTGEPRIIGKPNREVTALRKDGTTFPIELSVGEWWDHEQRKFTGIIRDITERKRAEQQLRASEARFREIAAHIEDVFYVHELDGTASYVSPAYEAVWATRAGGLCVGRAAGLDAIHDGDRERVTRAYDRMLAGGSLDEEYRVRYPDGALRWVRDRAVPVTDERGDAVRVIGVAQDITARRGLEEELRQAQKMEAVGTLASGIAHDFRNLLQGIMGCAYQALKQDELPGRAGSYIASIADAARRGANLTDQLMGFSRRAEVRPRPVAVDALIARTATLLERLLGEHIALAIETAAPGGVIMAEPVQLEQVLMNLAANASDAMPEGGALTIATGEVMLDADEARRRTLVAPGRYVRLVIRDTGVGMDERTRRRIFEPFFTTKGVGKGTGLGLSTVFAIARHLSGHIEVESEPGSGTAFVLYLPCCDEQPAIDPDRDAGEPLRFRGTILLVEDEPLVRATIRHYLEELGLAVMDASGAEAAFELCERHRGAIDALVSDVMMPGKIGPQLAERLRERYHDLPILYVSAHTMEELIERGTLAPGTAMLRKPFDRDALASALAGILPAEARVTPGPAEAGPAAARAVSIGAPARARGDAASGVGGGGGGEESAAGGAGRRATLLLVEDNDTARGALVELLEDLGYAVIATALPSEALAAANPAAPAGQGRPRIDLLLTDLSLPEMDGAELARRVRASQPGVEVIFMSGSAGLPDGVEGAFLQKPIAFDVLAELLQSTIPVG